jgi:exoribonuclease R
MKTLVDPQRALTAGLSAIRDEFSVPAGFAPDVLAAAEAAKKRPLSAHVDRTAMRFVTLDPASSTDLDQAFAIEQAGADVLLHYAIADVAWFVEDGDALDVEAWARGETLYLPDGKASLYPPLLSEGAASLLPDGDRPAVVFAVRVAPDGAVKLDGAERAAVIFTVRIAPDGGASLDGVERAVIRSSAKLAYETVQPADLPPGFDELSRRIAAAGAARGASRVDPPEQEIERGDDDKLHHAFRPRRVSEDRNAAMSLATNLAVAEALQAHHTGLFRVMPAPDAGAVRRLRHTIHALGVLWPRDESLEHFSRRLRADDPKQAAAMLAIRRAGHGASYAPYQEGVKPWHAAVAATYAQATAPLRRLADRYVVRAALAVANGEAVPGAVSAAFEKLPHVMARAESQSGRIDRAVIDLAEAVLLAGREGEVFAGTVVDVDDRGARVQFNDYPVVVRVAAPGVVPGEPLDVELDAVDVAKRTTHFVPVARIGARAAS